MNAYRNNWPNRYETWNIESYDVNRLKKEYFYRTWYLHIISNTFFSLTFIRVEILVKL